MKGLIFNVKRYSVNDGPGIRVTFFMKGCPLSCLWCHNPEGINSLPEIVKQTSRIGENEFSSEVELGTFYSVENILEILEKEKVFFNHSNGGVTFSGGEPMAQSEFLLEVLKSCKTNGYHTAVDTSGYSSSNNYKNISAYTDLFLFDIKHIDRGKHLDYTGVSNSEILRNYRFLLNTGCEIHVRIPIIPGYNDDNDHLTELKNFLVTTKTDSLTMINLLPYHKTGSSKYQRFNIPVRMEKQESPSKVKMQAIRQIFNEVGVKVKIGG